MDPVISSTGAHSANFSATKVVNRHQIMERLTRPHDVQERQVIDILTEGSYYYVIVDYHAVLTSWFIFRPCERRGSERHLLNNNNIIIIKNIDKKIKKKIIRSDFNHRLLHKRGVTLLPIELWTKPPDPMKLSFEFFIDVDTTFR